jgi:type IV pilus assembly protein PilP
VNKNVFILFFCFLLVGCGSGRRIAEHQKYIDEVKQRPPEKVDPIPEFKRFEKFKYSADKLRSPFVLKAQQGLAMDRPDINRPKEELEGFSLDSLKMVGILRKGNQTWALILAPDQTVHRVKEGSHLGKDYGRVESVTKDNILLIETIPAKAGGWEKREVSMRLSGD